MGPRGGLQPRGISAGLPGRREHPGQMRLAPGMDLTVLTNSRMGWWWGGEGTDGVGNYVLLGNSCCGHHSLDSL